ncbi:hypothetical protein ES703_08401 [subsurface metagenome]
MSRDAKFRADFGMSPQPVAGITVLDRGSVEPTLQELLEGLDKSDIKEKQKEELLAKLDERIDKIRGHKEEKAPVERKLKRYLVDPETGKIDIDEEEGEYTYKDALLLSASIKGKGGQFQDAINLIKTVMALGEVNQAKTDEKPKEFYVDPQTAVIVHDPENGEYTLSEARAVSQSMQRGPEDKPKVIQFLDSDGQLIEAPPGQPIIITKKEQQQPSKTYFVNAEGKVVEQEAGKPIVVEIKAPSNNVPMLPFPVMDSNGQPTYDKEGKPIYANLEPMMKYLGFLGDQRRADERHNALMGLTKTVRENVGDGISALKAAAAEAKGSSSKAPVKEPQLYECAQCHMQFGVPAGEWEKVACPSCHTEYSREEILGV